MPRDGSGTYSLPANSLVSTGTASSAQFNNTITDIQSALTQSLSKDGQTPYTGSLKGYAGTVTAPTYAFSADPTTGWYQSATGYITSAIAGVKGIETSAKGFNDGAPATIASAATTDLSTVASNTVTVTGTTTITSLGTTDAGIVKRLVFAGALTLTYNATSLILPNQANITTLAGDVAIMQSLGSGNWRCVSYTRINGNFIGDASFNTIISGGNPILNFASGSYFYYDRTSNFFSFNIASAPKATINSTGIAGDGSQLSNLTIPLTPKTTAAAGQWLAVSVAATTYTLPAGGTWAWVLAGNNGSGGVIDSTAGVSAGGTSVYSNASAATVRGFVWRIA